MTENMLKTLKDVNNALHSLGLATMSEAESHELTRIYAKGQFLQVLRLSLGGDGLAKGKLIEMLQKSGIRVAAQAAHPGSGETASQGASSPVGSSCAPEHQESRETSRYADRPKSRVYGTKGTFELTMDEDLKVMATGAPAKPGVSGKPSKGERRYDYDRKIVIGISDGEMYSLAAFLSILREDFAADFHGKANTKHLEMKWQRDKEGRRYIYATMRDKETDTALGVQIPLASAVDMAMLVMSAYTRRYPALSPKYLTEVMGRAEARAPASRAVRAA